MDLRGRSENSRNVQKRVLIVCEGARTEPKYFESFKVFKYCSVVGSGSNTVSVIKHAIRLMAGEKFQEVWCVFDRDSFPKKNVKAALELAKNNKIKVALSNESFELWYVLHFEYLDTKITRHAYCQRLGSLLGKQYEKNDASMFEQLKGRQIVAIKNAKRLEKTMLIPGVCVVDSYPYTTVYKLVERLNALANKRAFQK